MLSNGAAMRGWQAAHHVLYFLTEDASMYAPVVAVVWLFDLIQTLSFPLNVASNLAWSGSPLMQSLMTGLSFLQAVPSLEARADLNPTPADSLWVAMVAFVLLVLMAFILAMWLHVQVPAASVLDAAHDKVDIDAQRSGGGLRQPGLGNATTGEQTGEKVQLKMPTWALQALRFTTLIAIHGMMVPVVAGLLSPLFCQRDSNWLMTNLRCWEGTHSAHVAVSIILLPVWISWALVMAVCMVNRVPDFTGKHNTMCAAHGRVTAAMIVVKVVLCLAYTFSSQLLDPWAYIIVNIACGVAWLGLYLVYLPYFHMRWNQLQAAFACCFIAAAGTATLQKGINRLDNDSGAVAFLCLLPMAAYAGYSLVAMRLHSFSEPRELTSPFAVELRLRCIVLDAAAQLGHGYDAAKAFAEVQKLDSFANTSARPTDRLSEVRRKEEEQNLLHNDEADRIVTYALHQMDGVVHDAMAAFSTSAIMHVFVAHYVGTFKHNKHLERVHLAAAAQRADQLSFDCRWFAYVRNLRFQQDDTSTFQGPISSSGMRMTVARRMQYERLLELSRAQVTETRALMLSFWEQLTSKHPDLRRLQTTGTAVTAALAETDTTFQRLLDIAPQSAAVMRLYGDFLLELANDTAKGRELLTDAETLEDEQSRVRSGGTDASDAEIPFGGLTEFDLSAESLALVRVSAEPGKLGIITDCNAAFLKIIGYNRREVIGREMSFIIPEPIGAIHPLYLERYQSTGVERVANRSRSLFCAHRSGYLVPVKINIRPSADCFVAVLESIVSPLSYLFFLGEEEGWRVSSACKSSLSLLGIDVPLLKAGKVSMTAFLDNVAAHVEHLLAAADGLTIRLGPHTVNAKLQSVTVPHVPTPIYIMRYHMLSSADEDNSVVRAHTGTVEEDDHSDASSDRASGSDSAENRVILSPAARMTSKRSFKSTGKVPAGHVALGSGADISRCPVTGRSRSRSTHSANASQSGDSSRGHSQPNDNSGNGPMQLPGGRSEENPVATALFSSAAQTVELGTHASPPPRILTPVSPRHRADPLMRMVTDTDVLSPRAADSPAAAMMQSALKRKEVTANKLRQPQPVRFSQADNNEDDYSQQSRSQIDGMTPGGMTPGGMTPGGMTPGGMSEQFTGIDTGARMFPSSRGSATGGGKPGAPGSVQSADSSSSATEILRRGVLRSGLRLEGSLALLRRSLLFVFCVIAALNIAAVSVTTSLFRQMEGNIELVVMNGDRALYMNRACGHLQSLVLAGEGVFVIPEGGEYVQAKLEKWTANFERLHRQLYLAVDDSLEEERLLYTAPSIVLHDLVPGAYKDVAHFDVMPRTTSLINAGLEFVGKLRLANSLPPSNISMAEDDVFFVIENGDGDLRHALNQSLMYADARSRSHADNVLLANIVVCAVAEIMLVAIVMVIVIPSVNQVIRSKNTIFESFLQVPLPALRALKHRVQKKIDAAQLAAENDDVAIDLDMPDEYDYDHDAELKAGAGVAAGVLAGSQVSEADLRATRAYSGGPPSLRDVDRHSQNSIGGGGGSGRTLSASRAGRTISEEPSRFAWRCCCRRTQETTLQEQATTTRRGKHKRRYSNMRSSNFSVLLSMVWPLVIFMVYFGATYVWKQGVVAEVKYVRNEILWTMQQRFYLGEINFYLRDAYAYCDPEYVAGALNRAEYAMDQMEYLTDGLMYGSTAMHLRPGVQISPALAQIALVNGCVDHVGEYYNMSACQTTFYEGLFSKGMIQGFKEFTHDVRVLLLQRRAALADDPTGASLCADPTSTGDRRYPLNDPRVDAVDQMRWRYLAAVTNAAATVRMDYSRALFSSFSAHDLSLSLSCIVALGVFYLVTYAPQIAALDRDIKQVRHLLLLFPEEVTRTVAAMQEVGRVLLRDNASVRSA